MTPTIRTLADIAPEKLGDYLEAVYDIERDESDWLTGVMRTVRDVCGATLDVFGYVYDASDVESFCARTLLFDGFCDSACDALAAGADLHTPSMVVRTYRSLLIGRMTKNALPEMRPVMESMRRFGYADALIINGLDPSGLGVALALWSSELPSLPHTTLEVYRRMAHHLGAAHRVRRRLRENEPGNVAQEHRDRVSGLEVLSSREQQVVAHLASGQSTKEVAYALGISDSTVRVLLARAAARLGLRSRDDLLNHYEVRRLQLSNPRDPQPVTEIRSAPAR